MKHLPGLTGWILLSGLGSCATGALEPLVLEGSELHASLGPRAIEDANHGLPDGVVRTPQLATDAAVIESIARHATQGNFGADGVRTALFALYEGAAEVGFYALEAATDPDADRLEDELYGIWEKNMSLGRAQVHRKGRVFVIVWQDGVSPDCWQEVNDALNRRLSLP